MNYNGLVQLSEITKQISLKSPCMKTFKHHCWQWILEWEKLTKYICEPISEAGRQLCQTPTTNRFSVRRQYHLRLRVYLLFIYWYFCLKIITTSHLYLQALFQRGSNVFLSKYVLKNPIISIHLMSVSLSCQNDNEGTTYGKERKKESGKWTNKKAKISQSSYYLGWMQKKR